MQACLPQLLPTPASSIHEVLLTKATLSPVTLPSSALPWAPTSRVLSEKSYQRFVGKVQSPPGDAVAHRGW